MHAFRPFMDGVAELSAKTANPHLVGISIQDNGLRRGRKRAWAGSLPKDFLYPFGMGKFLSASFYDYITRIALRLCGNAPDAFPSLLSGLIDVKSRPYAGKTAKSKTTRIAFKGARDG
jgi:hypothetical protein